MWYNFENRLLYIVYLLKVWHFRFADLRCDDQIYTTRIILIWLLLVDLIKEKDLDQSFSHISSFQIIFQFILIWRLTRLSIHSQTHNNFPVFQIVRRTSKLVKFDESYQSSKVTVSTLWIRSELIGYPISMQIKRHSVKTVSLEIYRSTAISKNFTNLMSFSRVTLTL